MNTLDWYPWYWKNWRLSEARESMNGVERGIYRELLDVCWADGSIPGDLLTLAKLTAHDLPTLKAAWPVVGRWFEPRHDGRLYNPQMSAIRAEQELRYATLSKRGKKGAKTRWQRPKNATAIAQAKPLQTEREIDSLSESSTTAPSAGGGGPVLCNCGGAKRKSGIHSPDCPLALKVVS